MTRLTARIAKNLREARDAAGLSQEALARRAGVSTRTVVRLEGQEIENPRPTEFAKIAQALGLTPDDLRGIDELPGDDPDSAANFRAELARRYGHENAEFVDEVATKIKDFPARDAALVRLLLLGAVRAADPRPRGSPDEMSEIGSLARVN